MTILVLGHLVLDEIHSLDGQVYETPGGITFPLEAFSAVTAQDDVLLPVFPVGTDARAAFDMRLANASHVDTSGVYTVTEPTTRVRLFHESRSQYNTQLVTALPPIGPQRYAAQLAQADLVYVNMMTGSDVLPAHLPELKAPGRLVYIDLHMIAYRVHADGRREPAGSDWHSWVAAADIVQCNEREFSALAGPGMSEEVMVRHMFATEGPSVIVVTHAENGVHIWRKDAGLLKVNAVPAGKIVDPTGCGDTFGSVFAYYVAAGRDVDVAAGFAVHAASYVATLPGSDGMQGLRAHLEGVV